MTVILQQHCLPLPKQAQFTEGVDIRAVFSLLEHESELTSRFTPSLSVCLCHCLSAGVISCKINTLDRETKSQYVVVVKAQDMRGMPSGSTATTSVTINITDINDNLASFIRRKEQGSNIMCTVIIRKSLIWTHYTVFFFLSAGSYELEVPENHKVNEKIGLLELEDRDEIRNKDPIFTIPDDIRKVFNIELTNNKDGNLMLKKVGGFFLSDPPPYQMGLIPLYIYI